jgi:hypothetical protein
MNTAAVLSKLRPEPAGPITVDTRDHGPWFRMMAAETMLSDEQLFGREIGLLNLEAAMGLPGAENLNLNACMEMLNVWAEQVRAYTESRWYMFLRSPEEYENSPAYFRMLLFVTVLQRHLGIQYNLAFMEGDYDATDSRNLFLHGLLSGHGGTCVTMPILYCAIGRRLGYPLKLAHAKEHLFARWEEPGGERFNVECTSPGFRSLDDEHFRHLPKPLTDEELQSGHYLSNLRPREELATFLCQRTACLIDNLRLGEAVQAGFLACKSASRDPWARGAWTTATVMARALEQSRKQAGVEGYAGMDLRKVRVPEPGENAPDWERWAVCRARETLQRLARFHDKARAAARSRVFGALDEASGRHCADTIL